MYAAIIQPLSPRPTPTPHQEGSRAGRVWQPVQQGHRAARLAQRLRRSPGHTPPPPGPVSAARQTLEGDVAGGRVNRGRVNAPPAPASAHHRHVRFSRRSLRAHAQPRRPPCFTSSRKRERRRRAHRLNEAPATPYRSHAQSYAQLTSGHHTLQSGGASGAHISIL